MQVGSCLHGSKPFENLLVIVNHFDNVVLATHHLAKW